MELKEVEIDRFPNGFESRGIPEMVLVIHQKLLPNAQTTDTMVWNDYIQSGEPATTTILLSTLYTHLEPPHTVGTSRGHGEQGFRR